MTGRGVAALMYNSKRQVYVAMRVAKNRPYCGQFSGPGGSVEENEVPRDAIAREVAEECGLTLNKERFEFLEESGPHITPVEDQGTGTPFTMFWFAVALADNELPQRTEPDRQGEWVLTDPVFTIPGLTRGTLNALEILKRRWRQ